MTGFACVTCLKPLALVFREQAQLTAEAVEELDALTVLGGHSADVLRVDPAMTGFVADAWQRGVLIGALECGQMVLMSAGIIDGQRVVRPFLSRLGTFPSPVVSRPADAGRARGHGKLWYVVAVT